MRIFYASISTPSAAAGSSLWRRNLYESLVELGHDVVEFSYDLQETFRNADGQRPEQLEFIERNRPIVTAELLRQVREAHAKNPMDLFFSYFYSACVLPDAIDQIRALGITTVNWYCNASYQLHLVSEIAPHYDWCLVPEKFRLGDYEAMGAHPIYSQEAANPHVYHPVAAAKEFDVTFVGQAYGDRPGYISYLVDKGIDVRVFGKGWQEFSRPSVRPSPLRPLRRLRHVGGRLLTLDGWKTAAARMSGSALPAPAMRHIGLPTAVTGDLLSDDEMIATYSRSKINLGFSACGDTTGPDRILQVRLRDFEVPMSGGFYMVEYMEELEEFFDIGREIVCYRDRDDLVDKIRFYLAHDEDRERIRRAGHERALRDHAWTKRFQEAFRTMGLK